jgi:tetratricopeptide (TPR) repeat protein
MRRILHVHMLALAGVAALAAGARAGGNGDVDVNAIWKDPVFQKQFIAGYGFNADVEPRVTPDEVKILETVRPLMANDLPKAEATLKGKMKADSSAILDFTLGGIAFQQDRMADALDEYKKAVSKYPSFRRAWRCIGLIHAREGRFDDAIEAFTKMIVLGGGDAYSYGLLGFAYAAKQDYQPAEAAYRNALLLQPDNTEWRIGLTRSVLKQEKYEDAATLLNGLIQRYPDKADFWLLQAHTFMEMRQFLKAAQDFEAVDRLGASTIDSLNTLGDIYVNDGNLMDLAASAYRRAIELDPKQPIARPLRAAEYLAQRGALPQAREVAIRLRAVCAATLDDADQRKLLKLEARLSMAEGGGSAATANVLEEIVRLDPLDGEALMMLGDWYSRQSQPDKAIFDFERAESIDRYEQKAKLRHAQILVGMARYADAVPLLRQVQEKSPRDDVARYLEQVERLAKARR